MKQGQKAKKTPRLQTKIGKYFMMTQKGVAKNEAQRRAGFAMDNKSSQIEATSEYKALQEHFGTNLQKHITVNEINGYLADNIRQEGQTKIDRNARNKAIEISINLIEPQGKVGDDGSEKVLIILSK